ncbi:MAG: hypothetical protein Tsb0016_13540 [Sphingomonadales bacterium]
MLVSICAMNLETAIAAPVTFNTALPVSQGHGVGREQMIYAKGTAAGEAIRAIQSVTVLGYGVTPELAVFSMVPWASREADMAMGGERRVSGLGDIGLFARYTAYRHDISGGTVRLAPFLGVEIPTGESRRSGASGPVPLGLQPGSGSWDMLGGLVASWATLDLNIDGQVAWQINTRAHGFERGDVFQADMAIQRRLLPRVLDADTEGFLFGGIEINFQHEGMTRIGGMADANSGADRLFITPALQYARKRWMAEAGLQIPIAQSPNGTNVKQDIVLRLGIRLNL